MAAGRILGVRCPWFSSLRAGHAGWQHNLNMRLEGVHPKCPGGPERAQSKPSLRNREMGAERGPDAVVGRPGMCSLLESLQNRDPQVLVLPRDNCAWNLAVSPGTHTAGQSLGGRQPPPLRGLTSSSSPSAGCQALSSLAAHSLDEGVLAAAGGVSSLEVSINPKALAAVTLLLL